MLGLQKHFDRLVKSEFSPEKLGLTLISKKLKEHGITLTTAQNNKLRKQLKNLKNDSLILSFEDDQIFSAGFTSENEFKESVQHIFDELIEDTSELLDNFLDDDITKIIDDISDSIANILVESLKDSAKDMLADQEKLKNSFNKNLKKLWGKALKLLQMLIVMSLEAGEYFNKNNRQSASKNDDFVFEALTRLHAKACQISSEILTLLSNGFADGANARWRALHEISVVSHFIKDHGTEVAEKYLLHQHIEAHKSALQYQEYSSRLNMTSLSTKELEEIKQIHDQLIARFGKGYKNDHGWASDALDIEKPTFRDIEAKVNLDHLRPYYKMASNNIHANSSGIHFRLGLLNDDEFLLAGPSNIGLTDPGSLLGLSLTQITTVLLTYNTNLDALVIIKTMMILQNELDEVLFNIHQKFESN
jgi:hypothetical protein